MSSESTNLWRHVGLTITAMALVLVLVFRRDVLPFPFVVLTILYMAANYFVAVRRITYRWAPLVIAMVAIPMGSFVYFSHNSVWYWITNILSLLAGTGVSLLVFPDLKSQKMARS